MPYCTSEVSFCLLIHLGAGQYATSCYYWKSDGILTLVLLFLLLISSCCLLFFELFFNCYFSIICSDMLACLSATPSYSFFLKKPYLTCNWILESQTLGNYWIKQLMGNTPQEPNNYMKVIPAFSESARQIRWY